MDFLQIGSYACRPDDQLVVLNASPQREAWPGPWHQPDNHTPCIDYACNGCGRRASQKGVRLEKCGRCGVARFCSSACRTKAWNAHSRFCRHTHASGTASAQLATARHLARGLRVLAQAGVTVESLHPQQRERASAIAAAVDEHAHGRNLTTRAASSSPRSPRASASASASAAAGAAGRACVSCGAADAALLHSCELTVREFVLSGLCAFCQSDATGVEDGYGVADVVGFCEPPVAPPREAMTVWDPSRRRWTALEDVARDGTRLVAGSAVWATVDGEDTDAAAPLVAAAEPFTVLGFWCLAEGRLIGCGPSLREVEAWASCEPEGSGEVVCRSTLGSRRTVKVPARLLDDAARSGALRTVDPAAPARALVGLPAANPLALDLVELLRMAPLARLLTLCRVQGLRRDALKWHAADVLSSVHTLLTRVAAEADAALRQKGPARAWAEVFRLMHPAHQHLAVG